MMARGRPKKPPTECAYADCVRPVCAAGLCRRHYDQRRRTGNLRPLRPENAAPLALVHVRVPPDVADRARGHAVPLREILALASADWSGARDALRRWRDRR